MANQLIPAMQMAHEAYTAARKNGLADDIALAFARSYAGGHWREGGLYGFRDDEIKNGICGCSDCQLLRRTELGQTVKDLSAG